MKLQTLNKILLSAAAAAAMLFMTPGASAEVSDLPLISVKGQNCYYYDVQPKETIYQVAQRLGITRDRIIEFNPSAADGLKPKMRLFFPVKEFSGDDAQLENRKAVYANAAGVKQHVVKKGETLYGIAHMYGMTPDELALMNPSAADGLKTGDILIINEGEVTSDYVADADDSAEISVGQPDEDGMVRHTIKKGETLFGIANSYNIALEAMLEANPSLDPLKYKVGQVINVPVGQLAEDYAAHVTANAAPTLVVPSKAASPAEAEEKDSGEDEISRRYPGAYDNTTVIVAGEEDGEEVNADNSDTEDNDDDDTGNDIEEYAEPLNVAVLLPFMLDEPTMSRTTQLYTEFFKGMLMGAEDMQQQEGIPVIFHFFDTSASLDSVNSILHRPVMEDIDLVVAPDNVSHLSAIVESVGDEVPVLNIFAVKDESYRTHRNLIQTNIPHDAMYAKAIEMFMEKYAGYTPVFLSRSDGVADKETFTGGLKKCLAAKDVQYREINYPTSLTEGDLAGIDAASGPVVFVPNSGSKTEFAKFIGAITAFRDNAPDPSSVTLFGYPEWVTFRGDSFDDICSMEATVYSRFMANDEDADTRRLKDRYKQLYGTEMFEAVPTQGILGYDIATFIVKGLREKENTGVFPPEFDGIQSYWRLGWSGVSVTDEATGEVTSNGGPVNEALYFINYRPGGVVEWKK
ncbi:MAG: LysM peptidoglycan-binding domain-containing protein [Bacteroidales bacterium]|nr:LysM peptidoglycan-binding domain-containing protein [Bacteroidales bacterium]